jgi:hypothetical protein
MQRVLVLVVLVGGCAGATTSPTRTLRQSTMAKIPCRAGNILSLPPEAVAVVDAGVGDPDAGYGYDFAKVEMRRTGTDEEDTRVISSLLGNVGEPPLLTLLSPEQNGLRVTSYRQRQVVSAAIISGDRSCTVRRLDVEDVGAGSCSATRWTFGISADSCAVLRSCFARAGFWESPSTDPKFALTISEGRGWIVEGANGRQLHAVRRVGSTTDQALEDCVDKMLTQTGVTLDGSPP